MNLNTGELIAVKQLEYMDSVEAVCAGRGGGSACGAPVGSAALSCCTLPVGHLWVVLSPSAGQDREKVESLESEIAIMRTLRHPNICGYLGTERSEGEDTKILNILLE